MQNTNSKVKGFTLIELMVVMAIIGILASIAYPSYTQYTVRAKRSDGMAALNLASQAMERFRANNYSYETGDDITQVFTDQVPVDGGTPYYQLSVVDDVSTYTLTATPLGALAGRDGALTLTNAGVRNWTDSYGTLHTCWPEGGNSC
ncbi:MAG: general secretion pathway protein GspH [Gammaproteobacteria bacterium]|nr:MAG: general secretion pathway protein GspH [Gammaproteobacteria bacterium]